MVDGPRSPRPPSWHGAADAWFKLLGSVVLAYLILAQLVTFVDDFSQVAWIAAGALFLAYFVYPAVRWLNGRLPLWAALTVIYLLGALCIALIVYAILPPALVQLQSLSHYVPQLQRDYYGLVNDPHTPLLNRLPASVHSYLDKLPAQLNTMVAGNVAGFTAQLFTILASVATIAALLVAVPIVSVYMLAESPGIKRSFLSVFPLRHRALVLDILSDLETAVGGFIRGQVVVAGLVAIMAIAVLALLHVPFALVIGIWAGLADVVPYVGPFAGGIPALVLAFVHNGWGSALAVVVAFVAINQIEAHLLGPRIVSRTVKISPLTVIAALLVGAKIFGFIGLIIGVPLAGVIRVLFIHLFPNREIPEPAEVNPGLTEGARIDALGAEPEAGREPERDRV